jgi:VanZ family protein
MRETLNRLGLLFLIALISYGSLSSGSSPVSAGGLPIHFVAYFVLSSAFILNFHDTERGHLEAMLSAGLVALGIEVVQAFLPYRSFSLIDFAVSFAGASLITLDHHIGLVTRFVEFEDRVIERFLM